MEGQKRDLAFADVTGSWNESGNSCAEDCRGFPLKRLGDRLSELFSINQRARASVLGEGKCSCNVIFVIADTLTTHPSCLFLFLDELTRCAVEFLWRIKAGMTVSTRVVTSLGYSQGTRTTQKQNAYRRNGEL